MLAVIASAVIFVVSAICGFIGELRLDQAAEVIVRQGVQLGAKGMVSDKGLDHMRRHFAAIDPDADQLAAVGGIGGVGVNRDVSGLDASVVVTVELAGSRVGL